MQPSNFRIENVSRAVLNGRACVLFVAFRRQGAAFVRIGQFSAPVRTAKRDLWKVAAAA